MNISDTIKERLRKIYVLATQGVDGEREAAKHQLQALMAKYGLTVDDIVSEKREKFSFTIPKLKDEQTVFWQVIFKYLNKQKIEYARSRSTIWINLTKEEYIDIKSMHEFYLTEYRKDKAEHLSLFAEAFAIKNELRSDGGDEDEGDESKITPAQMRRAFAALALAGNMEVKRYHRQIECAKNRKKD